MDMNNKITIGRGNDKRENYAKRVQFVDQDEKDYDGDENTLVLNVNEKSGKETGKPFYTEVVINGQKLITMVDMGSPVAIFAVNEIRRITKRKTFKLEGR